MITSAKNDRVRALRRLQRARGRREAGATLVEGPKLVEAARVAGAEIREVWAMDGSGDVTCSREVITALSTTGEPQSPVAVVGIPTWQPVRGRSMVVLWDVTDPGNVGSIIRTATGFGFDVGLTPACADPWSPKVIRAGAGSQFGSPLSQVDDLADLDGLTLVASVSSGGIDPGSLSVRPIALLIGNESRGLPAGVVSGADTIVSLPMFGGVESLNAAVAAAVLLWELRP